LIAVVVVAAFGATARADTAAELQARGEALAKDGHFTDAIDAFKQADRLEVRASHACLIALAYTRRELWPEAEVWLDTCQKRVKPGDSYPDWGPEMEKQIAQRLAAASVAAVEIVVEPPGVAAQISAPSFPPDETFGPRTIHPPLGHHVIFARAPGYRDGERAIDITDKTPQRVVIVLNPIATGAPSPRGRSLLIAGGVTAAVGGVTLGLMAFEYYKLDAASNANSSTRYGDHKTLYDVARIATLATWTASAALLITGEILHRRSAESPTLAAVPVDGGAIVSIGWQR
jgi:hypothetical protein